MTGETRTEGFDEPVNVELTRGTIAALGAFLEEPGDHLLARREIDQPRAMALSHLVNGVESVCADSFRPDHPQILDAARKSMGEFT